MTEPLNIVIPMAGRGSRFADAAYKLPKPLIPVHGKPMVQWVVENLRPSRPHRFVFLCLVEHLERYGAGQTLARIAPGSETVAVDHITEGPACTVLLARTLIDNAAPLMIANSDQWIAVNIDDYLPQADDPALAGLIMTMRADHPKWSYVRLDEEGEVIEVVEKEVVSDEATVGIYNFARGADYIRAADQMIARGLRVNGEFYVAPVYNRLIAEGERIGYTNVGAVGDVVYGLGTPTDLDAFLASPVSRALSPPSSYDADNGAAHQ